MNRYVDVSATNNGDGTTSAQAGSPGGVGAWNSLIAALKGTAGYAPAAGDVVYVRTKASGSNLGEASGANTNITFSTTPTVDAPIEWIFDDGTIWSGDNGQFKLTMNGSAIITHKQYHNLRAGDASVSSVAGRLWIYFDYAATGTLMNAFDIGNIEGVTLESTKVSSARGIKYFFVDRVRTTFTNCRFNIGCAYDSGISHPVFATPNYGGQIIFNSCLFDLSGVGVLLGLISIGANGGRALLNGGQVINANETNSLWRGSATTMGQIEAYNFDPGVLILTNSNTTEYNVMLDGTFMSLSGIAGKSTDFYYEDLVNNIQWREGANYPTLNAVLPDGASTPWSFKVYPKYSRKAKEGLCSFINEQYTQSPATKTFTFEMLISENYSTPQKDNWWVELTYIDNSTGKTKTISSKTAGNLATSTAAWTVAYYGATNYNKYKIAITTPTAIKQYSILQAVIKSNYQSPSVNDFYFVDPEMVIS